MAVVIAYMVIEAASREELESAVKDALRKGWQPLGGVSVSDGKFFQAMAGQ